MKSADTVMVYNFEYRDEGARMWGQSPAPATMEAIAAHGWRAVPDSGSVVADLREAYSWAVDEFAAPEARAALPGLLGELAARPELARLVRAEVIAPEDPPDPARLRVELEDPPRGELPQASRPH